MIASPLGIAGPGDYLSEEFLRCIRAKLDLVVASVAENPGKTIVWSDVDIRFFDLTPSALDFELQRSGCDILFQRECPRMADVNTGFFVCRCTPAILDFFQTIRAELQSHPEENEQMVVNRLLNGKSGTWNAELKMTTGNHNPGKNHFWGHLPRSFYARTQGWPPPRKLAIYHANYTKGSDAIGQKMEQFKEIDGIARGGTPAWIWSVLRRMPGKIGLSG